MMESISIRTKKASDERDRQRIIAERRKARKESVRNDAVEGEDDHNGEPMNLHRIMKDLTKINAELENVEVPPQPVRPEQEYMPSIQVSNVFHDSRGS